MALYLKNARFIDWETHEFKLTDIKIYNGTDGKIELYPPKSIPSEKDEIVNCSGMYVTKSFACGHHHVYSALARGMPAPPKTPQNFYEILKYIWWTLDKNLDKEMIELSAMVTAIDCAKNGVTFVIDHHSSPFAIEGSLETIAGAFDKVGISHLLCYEISDRDGKEITNKAIAETENYLNNHQGLVGLHASFTVGDETLNKATDIANKYNTGIHIHVAEDKYDQGYCQSHFNKRVVERMNDFGVLNSSKTILGHCIHVNDSEREILSKSNAWIVQNTESNLNNNVGYFNSEGMGGRIMLGTDGMHSDMLRSAKASFFVGQNFDNIDFNEAYRRLRNVNNYINGNGFTGDGENNLVIIDYPSPTDFNKDNFPGHFIFGLESKHIRHVISNGKLIVRDKKITGQDEDYILKESRRASKILWKKMKASAI